MMRTLIAVPDGSTVDEATGQAVPPKTSADHSWDWSTNGWVDVRSLAERKVKKRAELNAARRVATDAPLVTPYGTFDCDGASRTNIANAVALSDKLLARGLPADVGFILADDTRVLLTNEQIGDVGLLLGARVQGAYDTGANLKASLELASTAEEIDAISWPP